MSYTTKSKLESADKISPVRCKGFGIQRDNGCLSMREAEDFRAECDAYIDEQIKEWQRDVASAHLPEKLEDFDWDVYRRGLLETAYRIRLLRVIESKAISQIAKTSPDAAKIWAEYEADEMTHDEMFLDDLVNSGVDISVINQYEPSLETKLLVGYFAYLLEHEGPLGVVSYSYLVEYVNVKMEMNRVDILSKLLSEPMVIGQRAHAYTDINHDHPTMVWECLSKLIKTENDKRAVFVYFDNFKKLLMMFMNGDDIKEGIKDSGNAIA
ncbi:heme oxygenase-like domain-containing protein [Halomonas faecis]|uniref:hypothetical protein n=1 Tax=Halomonas faecis TaxID=1562110 RepID=UPI001969E9DD|nr:hypothetical protein [Halomonas faecis]